MYYNIYGRNDNVSGRYTLNVSDTNLIVPMHDYLSASRAQILVDIPRKGIIIVNQQCRHVFRNKSWCLTK